MHPVVAADRCTLEPRDSEVAQEIISSTRVLVSTVGSLLRESALREVRTEAGAISFALCGEATHTMKFSVDMLLAALGKVVNKETCLGFVGDPCQVKTTLKTLNCTSILHVACGLGLSVVGWILDVLLADNPSPEAFVHGVDLLNRYKTSQRCRPLTCDAVNKLAPMCLPGPPEFWETVVE